MCVMHEVDIVSSCFSTSETSIRSVLTYDYSLYLYYQRDCRSFFQDIRIAFFDSEYAFEGIFF